MTSTARPPERRLGKKLGVVHDPRTLRAARILDAPAVRAPADHRIARPLHGVPMFANDRFGDCTCASQAHRIVTQERSSQQARTITLTDDDVLAAYAAVTGFRPDDPSTDNGAYELDVLNFMRKTGMGREKDGSPHTIGAFAAVDWRNHDEFEAAHYAFGGLKVCAALPRTAQPQTGGVWKVEGNPKHDPASRPGSWGGHSMYSFAYNRTGPVVWTWGNEQQMTWEWADTYVDECYALISEDYLRGSGHTPQGLDLVMLTDYLATLNG
jgi:hypothetical protein